ncbi:MAG: type II toxin-antitoxin system PemK/MazF family toxin [Gemmataceae bacterium]|nr:type II toxin-antitoxin system PemK/MazF family toxin [Gemmataceae bacterium]
MHVERGQVISARFPHASGGRGKKRPVVVVQTDIYNKRLRHAVVAQLTTNLDDKDDPACFLIEEHRKGKRPGFFRTAFSPGICCR